MLVIPAVDVRDGRTVRLRQGDYGREIAFDGEPAAVARAFIAAGARRLHVVDLDAARGRPDERSRAAAAAIVTAAREVGCEVEIGGGVRDAAAAKAWFDCGASHVVIGSVAVRDPAGARAMCERNPGRVLIALDVGDGRARIEGWTEPGANADSILASWNAWGAAGVIYTDTERDGMLTGPDLAGLDRCRSIFSGPVILSGGMRDVGDAVHAAEHGAAGVVVGRALLEGRFDLRQAIDAVAVAP
ncbi:MAG TPA: 1-(5-phosphoribosyl)-5-[(5-phosphoribosylamino)methylideneamino] imidazole-4-carboxamide isomerase [Candidatus Dormibacteraeota bacterium]